MWHYFITIKIRCRILFSHNWPLNKPKQANNAWSVKSSHCLFYEDITQHSYFFLFLVEALKLQQSPCQEAQPHCPNIPVCARASCERTSRWMRPGLCDVRRSRLRRTPRLQLHYSTPHKGRARAFMTCRSGIQNDTVERVSIRIQLGRGGSRIRFALWEKWIRECAFPADGYKFCMIYYYIFISTLRQGGINGRTDGATLVCFHWEEEHRYYSCKRLRDCSFNYCSCRYQPCSRSLCFHNAVQDSFGCKSGGCGEEEESIQTLRELATYSPCVLLEPDAKMQKDASGSWLRTFLQRYEQIRFELVLRLPLKVYFFIISRD